MTPTHTNPADAREELSAQHSIEQACNLDATPLQAIHTLIDALLEAHAHDDETVTKLLAIRGYHLPNLVETLQEDPKALATH